MQLPTSTHIITLMDQSPSLPDIASYAAPVYIIFILVEIIAVARRRATGDYEWKDTVTSLVMGSGNVASGILLSGSLLAGIAAIYALVHQVALFNIGYVWWAFVLCFVLDDFVYYWSHRFSHTIRWGWADHVIHHSSQHFNLSTALRQPWFSAFKGFFILGIPLVWLGFPPAMVAFVGSLNLFYQFFIHTEAVDRLPRPIEWIFNTPSHHRVHHGKNPKYLDANYAGVLIIWDRLFGTFVAEDRNEPVRYGLVHDIGTFNPLRVATHEYITMARDATQPGLSLKARLGYIFAPPGWRHDGQSQTSKDLKTGADAAIERDASVGSDLAHQIVAD